ncbi:hypothetical protein Ctob_016436 [Chrysochromulina tobinii]|jgi:hypothetical protein|uniref:Uncharacterized protein n=1 Tax=Chrysochromulina tobinii TaxID=1460289 RepID=A0A0M0JWQ8_9EUKA|nr:hypothetical protein Ctob_016436 [Chrysochromulina tobinii]|eukprot:KOO30965.1 hypothetical protein Ctob_016436 [Chrysochromulina sp. CCMP291]
MMARSVEANKVMMGDAVVERAEAMMGVAVVERAEAVLVVVDQAEAVHERARPRNNQLPMPSSNHFSPRHYQAVSST